MTKKDKITICVAVFMSMLITILGIIVFTSNSPDVEEQGEITTVAANTMGCDAYQSRLYDLHNQYREANDLSVLAPSDKLIRAAKLKVYDMIDSNTGEITYWSHENPLDDKTNSRMDTAVWIMHGIGYEYHKAGENMSKDFTDPDRTFNAWLASPSHLENIEDQVYNEIGIYTYCDGLHNLTIVLFGYNE